MSDTPPQPPNDQRDWRPLKFSLREAFVVMTVMAVLFCVFRLLNKDFRDALGVMFGVVIAWFYIKILTLEDAP